MTELCVDVPPCGKAVHGIRRAAQEFWWSKERLVSYDFSFSYAALCNAPKTVFVPPILMLLLLLLFLLSCEWIVTWKRENIGPLCNALLYGTFYGRQSHFRDGLTP